MLKRCGGNLVTQNKIKSVTVHYPSKENEEEFQRRAANAVAKVLFQIYPSDVINKLIIALEESENIMMHTN